MDGHTARIQCTVAIWDGCRSRSKLAEEVLAGSGAQLRTVRTLADISDAASSSVPALALVAIEGDCAADNVGLEIVRGFHKSGYRVVAYGGRAGEWPLALLCKALLAGAVRVLDSATADFAAQLRDVVDQAIAAATVRNDDDCRCRETMARLGIVGESAAILAIFRRVMRVSALSGFSVLITGETGTGKELFARAIHALDVKRRGAPLVALNCAALSPMLVESELFGHCRGAFTGAERHRRGAFRIADGGVLLLDEIGEMDLTLQAKLLRVLDNKRVLALGEDVETPVDVRVVAATNRDLKQMVHRNEFRADLFHRLATVSIHIPPLRERLEDLGALAQYFCARNPSPGSRVTARIDPLFIQALACLELPGNAREVENLIRQALVEKNDDTPLGLADLPAAVWRQISERVFEQMPANNLEATSSPPAIRPTDLVGLTAALLDRNEWRLEGALAQCEKLALQAALHATRGNRTETARLLGLTPRSIYNKTRKHRLAG